MHILYQKCRKHCFFIFTINSSYCCPFQWRGGKWSVRSSLMQALKKHTYTFCSTLRTWVQTKIWIKLCLKMHYFWKKKLKISKLC